MSTKLILVEGLPGSGKTTVAKMIHQQLLKANAQSVLYLEGDLSHPADYDGVAYFTPEQFQQLKKNHTKNHTILEDIAILIEDGYIFPYKKILQDKKTFLPEKLLKDIFEKDIYELPLEKHMHLILKRWKKFVQKQQKQKSITIFECCFIQNPVTVTMIREHAAKDITKNYIQQLAKIIQPLDPLLIYLEKVDLKASFERIIQERPKSWYEGFEQYYTKRGFGLHYRLRGLPGILEVLKERLKLEREIFMSLEMKKKWIKKDFLDIKLPLKITDFHF